MRRASDIFPSPMRGPLETYTGGAARPGRLERVFVVFAFMSFTKFIMFFSPDTINALGNYGGANLIRTLTLSLIYMVASVMLFMHHSGEFLRLIGRNKLLLVVIGYAILSALWATDPDDSIRRSVALGLSLIFVAYLVLRFPLIQIVELALIAFTIGAALTVLIKFLDGSLFSDVDYRWGGAESVSVEVGRVFAAGGLMTVVLWRSKWLFQKWDLLVLLLLLFCLARFDAVTATLSMVAGICSLVMFRSNPSVSTLAFRILIAMLVGVPVAVLMFENYGAILEFLGRNPTLTHRTYIWEAALDKGPPSELLGAGYRSFWVSAYAQDVWFNVFGSSRTAIGNGHNGYMDVWLELGWVGVGLVAALVGQMFVRCFKGVVYIGGPAVAFFAANFVFVLVNNVADKTILEHSEITWLLFMTGLVGLNWHLRWGTEGDRATVGSGQGRALAT